MTTEWFPDRPRRKGGGGIPNRDPMERFQEKVSHTDENGCHVWGGAANSRGYGCFCFGGRGKSVLAHRWAFEHLGGNTIPDGLVIDHLCRNRLCVNPDHMRVVTDLENKMCGESFSAVNARKTHCIHGHPLTGGNVSIDKKGRRSCRECRRMENRKYRRRVYWEKQGGEKNRKRKGRELKETK